MTSTFVPKTSAVSIYEGDAVPPLYATEDVSQDETVLRVKFFAGAFTWYVSEYSDVAPDGTPELAFGYIDGPFPEWGYISLPELRAVRFPLVERDLYFTPCTIGTLDR